MFHHHFIIAAALLASVSSQAICAGSGSSKVGCFFAKESGDNYEFRIETYKQVGTLLFFLCFQDISDSVLEQECKNQRFSLRGQTKKKDP